MCCFSATALVINSLRELKDGVAIVLVANQFSSLCIYYQTPYHLHCFLKTELKTWHILVVYQKLFIDFHIHAFRLDHHWVGIWSVQRTQESHSRPINLSVIPLIIKSHFRHQERQHKCLKMKYCVHNHAHTFQKSHNLSHFYTTSHPWLLNYTEIIVITRVPSSFTLNFSSSFVYNLNVILFHFSFLSICLFVWLHCHDED